MNIDYSPLYGLGRLNRVCNVEVYKIDTPFGTSLLLRSLVLDENCRRVREELERKHRMPTVAFFPSLEYDFLLDFRKEYFTEYALYHTCIFLCRVLGYPRGEYKALTPCGTRILNVGKEEKTSRPLRIKCKQMFEHTIETEGGNLMLFDCETEGGVYRLVPCYCCDNFDIKGVGASLLRYPCRQGDVGAVAAISKREAQTGFDLTACFSKVMEESCCRCFLFGAAAFYAFSTFPENTEIQLHSKHGSVSASRHGAHSLVLCADEYTVSRIFL